MLKRITSLLLAFLFIITGLCACNDGNGEVTSGGDTTPSDEPVITSGIKLADLKNYTVIRPDAASLELIGYAVDLNKALKPLNDGKTLTIKNDYFKEGIASLQPTEFEILVGETNRPETAEFKKTLRYDDYGYTIINKKVVIFGHTDETVNKAVQMFISEVISPLTADSEYFFNNTQFKTVSVSYPIKDVIINGNNLKDFVIVYPKSGSYGEADSAEKLASYLSEFSGYRVECKNDKEFEYSADNCEILIGKTNRTTNAPSSLGEKESFIETSGKSVVLTGGGYVGIYNAINRFKEQFTDNGGDTLSLTVESFKGEIEVEILKVMSFNILVSKRSSERDARVLKMIKNYSPDVFGVQEASPDWMSFLKANLGNEYGVVGLGRDGGTKGEYSAVFYKKDKFTLEGQGTKWLSSTPSTVSKVPESSLNRILSYAILKRNSDGKVFAHVNTHFDHTSDEARTKQAQILVDIVNDLSSKYPTIITGDFNTTKGTTAYNTIISAGYVNSFDIAPTRTEAGTFHGYSGKNSIIDFCFVSEGNVMVTKYSVANEKIDGDFASDHHPVIVDIIF